MQLNKPNQSNSTITGSSSVDAMISFRIQGNITPVSWYHTILRPNGKPYLLAIIILSDLVYWFRPVEIRDEQAGKSLGWKKRFQADLPQKSYQSYADMFGESKRSIRAAMDALEDLGVIRREFRNLKTANTVINNVMYIDLNVDVLKELTYPDSDDSDKISVGEAQNSVGDSYKITGESPAENCDTNTEITTKTTTENTVSIYPVSCDSDNNPMDGSDKQRTEKQYIELIKENICYDALMQSDSLSDRNMYEELYLLICDVVCRKCKTIRIAGEDLPYEVVKSRFLKLNMQHLQYVIHAVQNTTTKINNMRAYLLTTLYNAPTTMAAYWTQMANHDMHAGWSPEANIIWESQPI